ncbi:MAG: hypothetical protein JST21_08245 [Bacteroidetes bacterium]|nr:hypothetical protein [Bacteroidota bacterium]MBS1746145.1 hypothetical protein [Bacteroidota bacterium]
MANKSKIFRLDIFFWILLLVFGICWYLLDNKVMWQTIFLLTLIFYIALSFFIRAVYLQSIKENQQVSQLSDILKKQQVLNTSTWLSAHAVIVNMNPQGKVMDNGKEVGRLFVFQVQIDGTDGGTWRALIKDKIIPANHLNSFGRKTEVPVLYNPENKYKDVIFENDSWHYEVKK